MSRPASLEDVMKKGRVDLYGADAEFYDLVYSAGMANDSKELSARRNLDGGDRVLDLACGTGIVTERLDEDFNITGADISREMLEVARNKDLNADFIQSDMANLPFDEEFDAVIMYGQPLSHLESIERAAEAAASIYKALKPEGTLVTDLFSADAGAMENMNPVETEIGDYTVKMVPDFSDYNPSRQTWNGSIEFQLTNEQDSGSVISSRNVRGYSMEEIEQIIYDAGFDGLEEQRIFGGTLYHGLMAYKGKEPEVKRIPGFNF